MEQYEVKITEPAQRQLQEIIRYIAGDLQEKRTAIRMLDTLDAFLDTDLPVKRAEERRFVLQQDMPRQILLPVLVQ